MLCLIKRGTYIYLTWQWQHQQVLSWLESVLRLIADTCIFGHQGRHHLSVMPLDLQTLLQLPWPQVELSARNTKMQQNQHYRLSWVRSPSTAELQTTCITNRLNSLHHHNLNCAQMMMMRVIITLCRISVMLQWQKHHFSGD